MNVPKIQALHELADGMRSDANKHTTEWQAHVDSVEQVLDGINAVKV